ncbi:MAG: sulfur carrier protein ThiS [Nitrospirae bacterium]|nr:MAG: sulfur carrier protein ThiS [Nitrospirota bacterium]
MKIQVNGQPRIVSDGVTVAGLLRELNIPNERVAVEVNLSIVEQSDYDRRHLREGDRVEILSFIGGGSGESPRVSSQKSRQSSLRPVETKGTRGGNDDR